MADLTTLPTITTERDLHRWLAARRAEEQVSPYAATSPVDCPDPKSAFRDGGASCLDHLRHWNTGCRYVAVAFRDGKITFTSLPACARHFGMLTAVEVADRHRFNLMAVCRAYL
ncbi:hypothetical protein [Aureimonas sp. SK2]|uniref:hypothetical protein n=1 Tax=Aureimonas sp. SK2 TaxID=3015992 RepID=UPI002444BA83|nr:hypothetical protein [Aureimonas sp. SK2]